MIDPAVKKGSGGKPPPPGPDKDVKGDKLDN